MTDDSTGAPDPGSDSRVNSSSHATAESTWTAVVLSFAIVSFLSAVLIVSVTDSAVPAIGAVTLGLGFASFVAVSRVAGPSLLELLADAWAEHRPYVWFATGLFGLGTLFGVLLFFAGVDLLDLFSEFFEEALGDEFDDGDFTATFFIVNNTPPFLATIFGALTLGLVTVIIMVFNGILIGNVTVAMGVEVGFGPIIALLVPHGIFELPALFIAAGVGFRFLHRAGQRIAGSRDALFTRGYLARTALLVCFAWLVLVLAAFVEAYVTIAFAEILFPELAE